MSLSGAIGVISTRVRPGQKLAEALTAERINAIQEAILALARGENLRAGKGILKETAGISVTFASIATGEGGGDITHPFQISKAGANKVKIRYGTLNDATPTGVAVDRTLTGEGTHTIYLVLTLALTTLGEVTAVAVGSSTSGVPADDDTHAHIILGTAVMSGGSVTVVNQAVTHSLRFAACGRDNSPPADFIPGAYEFWGV